jgi:3',5'-cyclic AMP phosphodiesterase CpdA
MRNRPLVAACILLSLLALACVTGTAGPVTVETTPQSPAPLALTLPNKPGTVKFAVLGDFGNGSREQYELAAQMKRVHDAFPYTFVITVGDNIYGTDSPQNMVRRFEQPYKAILDAGVKFYASLGNHDGREQRYYKLFNMDGKLYYSFKPPAGDVRLFALETTYLDREQIAWIEEELRDSGEAWKIPFFHHPPYSSGGRHGSADEIRRVLEPLFVKYNVSVVMTGHDHFYERVKPQQGIVYFVVGAGGQLRRGDLRDGSPLTDKGFDTDRSFLVVEIDGDEMHFNAVTRTGQVIDSGVITRRK